MIAKLEKEALEMIQGQDKPDKGSRINRLGSLKVALREKRKLLKELDGKIIKHCAIEEMEKRVKKLRNELEIRIYEVLCTIDYIQKGNNDTEDVCIEASAGLTPMRARKSQTLSDGSPVTRQNVSLPGRSSSTYGKYATGIKLPQIQLAKFNGGINFIQIGRVASMLFTAMRLSLK